MCKINTFLSTLTPLSLQRNMTTPWLDFIPNERQDTSFDTTTHFFEGLIIIHGFT